MSARRLNEILSCGGRVTKRELFWALRRAGYEVTPTSKPTHFRVRGGRNLVIIATKGNDVLPVYLSRIAQALGLSKGDSDE